MTKQSTGRKFSPDRIPVKLHASQWWRHRDAFQIHMCKMLQFLNSLHKNVILLMLFLFCEFQCKHMLLVLVGIATVINALLWARLAYICPKSSPLRWRHNGHDCVSNHQPHDCLLNRLFRRRSKKTSKLRVTGLCAGNSRGTGDFPAQMASDAENVSIWGRHHVSQSLQSKNDIVDQSFPIVLSLTDCFHWGLMDVVAAVGRTWYVTRGHVSTFVLSTLLLYEQRYRDWLSRNGE